MQDILDRPEDDSLGAGVGTASVGEYAGNGSVVGLDLLLDLAGVFDDDMLLSDIAGLLWEDLLSISSTTCLLEATVTGSLSTPLMIWPRFLYLRFLFSRTHPQGRRRCDRRHSFRSGSLW